MPVQGLNFRTAVLADYDDVMAIQANIYEGFDYLKNRYKEYMENDNTYCYVAQLENEIVGFIALHVVDAGNAIVHGAVRVSVHHQRKGINSQMKKTTVNMVRKQVPSLKVMTWTTWDIPAMDDVRENYKAGKLQGRCVNRWGTLLFKNPLESVMENMAKRNPITSRKLRKLTPKEMQALLACPVRFKSLFPNDYFVASHFWCPLASKKQNIVDVTTTHHTWYSETAQGAEAVTFGYASEALLGTRYDIYINSTSCEVESLLNHYEKHLKHAITECKDNGSKTLGFIVHFLNEHKVEAVKGFFEPIMGENIKEKNLEREGALLFEVPLDVCK